MSNQPNQYTENDVGKLIAEIAETGHNPAASTRIIYRHLSEISNHRGGPRLVDTSNPFGVLLEASATMAAGSILSSLQNTRYATLALSSNKDELYRHVNDEDMVNVLASPTEATFTCMINYDQLLLELPDDLANNWKQVVIPSGSQITVENLTYLIEYDIHIRLYPNGVLEVSRHYASHTFLSAPFTSDIIISQIVKDTEGANWLIFDIPLRQMNIVTTWLDVQRSDVFEQYLEYSNNVAYVRVYLEDNGVFNEVPVFYHEEAINPEEPSVVVKILESTVRVAIPTVYTRDGRINGRVRIDIYETLGLLEVALHEYARASFGYELISTLEQVSTHYTNPFKNITLHFYSISQVQGGKNSLSFEELKSLIVSNSTGPNINPISFNQLYSKLYTMGYTLLYDTDIITRRTFFATRQLPPVLYDQFLRTPANISVETVIVDLVNLRELEGIKSNDIRITLAPEILYENVNGTIVILTVQQRNDLLALPRDLLVREVFNRQFMYTPFYYIIDSTLGTTTLRPYDLSEPLTEHLSHVYHNVTTDMMVHTQSAEIIKSSTGYTLRLYTKGDGTYNALPTTACFCQMRCLSRSGVYVHFQGVVVGLDGDGNKVFDIEMTSDFDIDSEHWLYLTNAYVGGLVRPAVGVQLTHSVDIYYTTTSISPTYVLSPEDEEISRLITPPDSVLIMKETLRITFGEFLDHLWRAVTSFPAVYEPMRHSSARPMYHRENLYTHYPQTGSIFNFGEDCDDISFEILAEKGQPVYDAEGRIVYEYLPGDLVKDSNGAPVMVQVNRYKRHLALTMVEGVFYFATQQTTSVYRQDIKRYIRSWCDDMKAIQRVVQENTKIYFHAGSTLRSLVVHTDKNEQVALPAQQSLTVNLHLRDRVFENEAVVDELRRRTVEIISTWITSNTLSTSHLTDLLTDAYGDAVLNVAVSGLGGNSNYPLVQVNQNTERLSLKKVLVLRSDKLYVTEDIRINFNTIKN